MTTPALPLVEDETREILGPRTGPVLRVLLTHNPKNGVTGGVWRVSAGERRAVLKVLTWSKEATGRWAATDEPRHWNYWRREAHVYKSGLAQVWQPYGIRAPRLLACVERADGDVALWLEDVRGEPGTSWTVARHVEHVRRLGAAQGAWVRRRADRGLRVAFRASTSAATPLGRSCSMTTARGRSRWFATIFP